MKAYLECGNCKKQSEVFINGKSKCPACGSEKVGRMSMGGSAPEWFGKEPASQPEKRNWSFRSLFGGR